VLLTKRLIELKGCIHKKMQSHSLRRGEAENVITIKGENFYLIIDLNDDSSRRRRQHYVGIHDSKLVA